MATKSQQDIIKNFMYYLDNTTYSGAKAVNRAVKYASGGYFSNYAAALNQMISDRKKAGSGDAFLKNYCGIIIGNADTGAITGSDAGGSKVKTAASIVPESGKLDSTFKGTSFEAQGLTFRLAKTSLTDNEAHIWQALKTWWAEEGLKLIKESYGYSFKDADATCTEIRVVFKNAPKDGYLAYTENPKKISGRYMLTLNINTYVYSSFASTDVNGTTSKDPGYLDRTIAHELTHAIMMAKVNAYEDLPRFLTEGLAELTHGTDDLRTYAVENLAKNYSTLKNNLSLTEPGASAYIYAGGYIFLRYLAKQSAANYLADVNVTEDFGMVKIDGSTLTVTKKFPDDTLDLAEYSSVKNVNAASLKKGLVILGNGKANSIVGGKSNDSILGGAGKDMLYGKAGDDTLIGGAGNDSLWGGTGADNFIYSSGDGKDIIFGFSNKDTLTLDGLDFKAAYKNDAVTLKVSGGSVTLKDFSAKTFHINGDTYKISGSTLVKK